MSEFTDAQRLANIQKLLADALPELEQVGRLLRNVAPGGLQRNFDGFVAELAAHRTTEGHDSQRAKASEMYFAMADERDSLKARVAELEAHIGTLMPQLHGVLAEREACAKLAEEYADCHSAIRHIAKTIRARGGQ